MAPMRWTRRRSPDMRSNALQQPVEETTGAWEDAYPSRVQPKPPGLPRLAPVVYASMQSAEGALPGSTLDDSHGAVFTFSTCPFSSTSARVSCAKLARFVHSPD